MKTSQFSAEQIVKILPAYDGPLIAKVQELATRDAHLRPATNHTNSC